MDRITTTIDAETGLLTIRKSRRGAEQFFSGADLTGGPGVDLRQPYKHSVWVLAAIRYVANPISSVSLKFTEDRRGGDVTVDDAVLNAFWEVPGQSCGGRMSRTAFMAATSSWLQLAGESFWIMDDSWLTAGGKRNPLILARPDRMREICDRETGKLLGWEFRDATGHTQPLIAEQVAHIKYFNPYHDVRGLAPWQAAAISAESDYAAGLFAKNLAENNGDRGPYVISDGSPSPEQIEQVTRVLREKRIMSRRGDFRPAFLAAPGMKIENPTVQAVDAAYVAQRLENRHEVFLAFGVPPSFASVTATYSIGSASDRFLLIEETCKPQAGLIAEGVEMVSKFIRPGGHTLFAEFDFDEHSTMQQVRAERFKVAVEGVDRGMPWKTANEYLNLGLPEFTGWNVGRVKFNMTEVDRPQKGTTEDAETTEEEGKSQPLDELRELFQCHAHGEKEVCKGNAETMKERDPVRVARWEAQLKMRGPWVKRFSSRFNRHLMIARGETLKNIETHYGASASKGVEITKAGVLDLVFDLGKWLGGFIDGMGNVSRNALEEAADEMWEDELDRDPDDDPLELPSAEVMTMVQARQNYIAGTGADIWNDVRGAIGDGIEEGDTMDEISERVRSSFNGISKERADRIAVTETTAAYEAGRFLTLKEAGIEWKEWLSSGDDRVRPTHQAADGQTVGMLEMFKVGQVEMLYPGMSGASASEVINCRCMMVAGSSPGEESDEE